MTYAGVLKNLSQRGVFRIRPGLGRIRRVLDALGKPQNSGSSVLIAGTNGKGSVAASLESILRKSGYKTGLYTSPHLIDVRERIKVNGADISENVFCLAAKLVLKTEKKCGLQLTYFEFLSAVAFVVFAQARVEMAVVECGMGGRWDATNTIESPALSIITSIGLDHTDYLGDTLPQIAREKSGILRKGGAAVSGVRGGVAKIIAREARLKGAQMAPLKSDFMKWRSLFGLQGSYQKDNLAIVLSAVDALKKQGWRITDSHLAAGLKDVHWPGRFQVITKDHGTPVLLDGAHNPAAVKALLKAIATSRFAHVLKTFIFSAYRDKDITEMGRLFSRVADEVCLCPVSGDRAATVAELRKSITSKHIPIRSFPRFEAAYQAARLDTPKDGLIVITGSLMLVGEALKMLLPSQSRGHAHV